MQIKNKKEKVTKMNNYSFLFHLFALKVSPSFVDVNWLYFAYWQTKVSFLKCEYV